MTARDLLLVAAVLCVAVAVGAVAVWAGCLAGAAGLVALWFLFDDDVEG